MEATLQVDGTYLAYEISKENERQTSIMPGSHNDDDENEDEHRPSMSGTPSAHGMTIMRMRLSITSAPRPHSAAITMRREGTTMVVETATGQEVTTERSSLALRSHPGL